MILEQLKIYKNAVIATILVSLIGLCLYQNSKIETLIAEKATLALSLSNETDALNACNNAVKVFNDAQAKASSDAAAAVTKAKKSSQGNYDTSRDFGNAKPISGDDYKNTTDLIDKYLDKRKSEPKVTK